MSVTVRTKPVVSDGNFDSRKRAFLRPRRRVTVKAAGLSDSAIKKLVAKAKPKKHYDTHGLHLLVQPTGAKWWRWDYRFGGRRKTLSLGVYPIVTLARAREKRDDGRRLLDQGDDPSRIRRRERAARAGDTVAVLIEEWLTKRARVRAWRTMKKDRMICRRYLEPALGALPVATVEPLDILAMLRPIDERGHFETCHRAKQTISQILRYAVATGRAARDVSADLRAALTPVQTVHFPAVTEPAKIGALLRAIDSVDGHPTVRAALALAPLVFVRPGELQHAEWKEIDLDAAIWRLPAEKMKTRQPHIVPLSKQAVAILRRHHEITGRGRYVFTSLRTPKRPMSDMTLTAALRRLGYGQDEQTVHGFRTIASTRLNELGWDPGLIELQLAHQERNQVRAAYNRAIRLEERAAMMQAYADHLDTLRAA